MCVGGWRRAACVCWSKFGKCVSVCVVIHTVRTEFYTISAHSQFLTHLFDLVLGFRLDLEWRSGRGLRKCDVSECPHKDSCKSVCVYFKGGRVFRWDTPSLVRRACQECVSLFLFSHFLLRRLKLSLIVWLLYWNLFVSPGEEIKDTWFPPG